MKIIALIIMIMVAMELPAVSESKITLMTDIPEDYGIEFPEATHIDHLYFGFENAPTERDLVRSQIIDVGHDEDYRLTLYYFGNLSGNYDVRLTAESEGGFRHVEHSSDPIPLDVHFEVPEVLEDDVDVDINLNGSSDVRIHPTGPVRGKKVVDMVFTWDAGSNAFPGEYIADVFIRMETV